MDSGQNAKNTGANFTLKILTAHFDVSNISTSVVTLSKVTLCRYKKSVRREKVQYNIIKQKMNTEKINVW